MPLQNQRQKKILENVANTGFSGMFPHEILEFMLFFTPLKANANVIAHKLISKFGTLAKVFEVSISELIEDGGIDYDTALLIKSVSLLYEKYLESSNNVQFINSSNLAGTFLVEYFNINDYENFLVIFLDNKNSVISTKIVTYYVDNVIDLDVAKVIKSCIHLKASSVVVGYNVSKISKYTPDHLTLSVDLTRSLGALSINLYDYLIITPPTFKSVLLL